MSASGSRWGLIFRLAPLLPLLVIVACLGGQTGTPDSFVPRCTASNERAARGSLTLAVVGEHVVFGAWRAASGESVPAQLVVLVRERAAELDDWQRRDCDDLELALSVQLRSEDGSFAVERDVVLRGNVTQAELRLEELTCDSDRPDAGNHACELEGTVTLTEGRAQVQLTDRSQAQGTREFSGEER